MLSPDEFHAVAETQAERFLKNPGDYLTETDLQVQLVSELRDAINQSGSTRHIDPQFDRVSGFKFKDVYEAAVEDGYRQNGISPVHTEVSFQKGERIDIGVIGTHNPTVHWENGSKKFDVADFDALFELKFVKNRRKPPTKSGFKPYEQRNKSIGRGVLNSALNWEAVGVKSDIKGLGRFTSTYRAVLVFSNFNYFYHRPAQHEVNHAPLYEDLGRAALDVIERAADDMAVNVIYVTPEKTGAGQGGGSYGGKTWIHEEV